MNNTPEASPEDDLDARIAALDTDDDVPEPVEDAPAEEQASADEPDDAEDSTDQPEDEEPEAPAQAEEQADHASDGEEETDDADLSPEHLKALRGLRLLHTPETVLQGLSERDAITWWNSRKKAETAINRQIAETNKQGATPTDSSGALGVPTAAKEPQAPSADEAALLAQLAEDFGPEAVAAIERFVELKTAPLRRVVEDTVHRTQAQVIEAARAKVGERFPGLMDDERWSAVQETAGYLNRDNPKFLAIEKERGTEAAFASLFEAAARAEGVREIDEQALARRRKVDAARRSGTPPVAPHRNAKPVPKNPDEAFELRIALAEKGLSAKEIRAQLG